MTWLKKLGVILATVAGDFVGLGPIIAPLIASWTKNNPTAAVVVGDLTAAANEIVTVEAAFTAAYGTDSKKGSDKLRAATPFIAKILLGAQFMDSKKIQNEALFEQGATKITDGLADVLNSVGE